MRSKSTGVQIIQAIKLIVDDRTVNGIGNTRWQVTGTLPCSSEGPKEAAVVVVRPKEYKHLAAMPAESKGRRSMDVRMRIISNLGVRAFGSFGASLDRKLSHIIVDSR